MNHYPHPKAMLTIRRCSFGGNVVALRLSGNPFHADHGFYPHLYPHLFDLAPLAPFRGEGLGVRGFALCFNWDFIRCCDALHCLGSQNKSLNRRLARNSPTPHPPAPSPRNGARGSKAQQIHADSLRYCSGGDQNVGKHEDKIRGIHLN